MNQSNKLKGWIYVISNKAMPGLVKIGYSTKDPKLRAEELDHTGSPHPYFVEYEMLIEEPFQIKQQIHKILKCDHEGKEWFRCSVEAAIIAIKKIADKSIIYEKVITSLPRDKKQDYGSSATKNTDEFVIPASTHFTVQGVKAICPNCGTPYSVTLHRYETKSTCPHCLRYHSVNVD